MKHIDTVIVGQGLAGSILAWTLIQAGESVLVIDDAHSSSSSMVAAGIMNPITGPRLVKHPLTEHYTHHALACYRNLQKHFKNSLFHEIPIIRLFNSLSEVDVYRKRSRDPDYNGYLGKSFTICNTPGIVNPLGGFYQLQTGYVDIPCLLRLLKEYFIQNSCYVSDSFNYAKISLQSKTVTYNSYRSDRIIFCEGYRLRYNPWFAGLPIIPTKGEILSLKSQEFSCPNIINNGHWLLPLQEGLYRFGASFEPRHEDTSISSEVRLRLMEKLNTMVPAKHAFKFIEQSAGIRPCTQDRMPLIGMHPRFRQIGVFNGFGSKGILTIPYFAQQFCRSFQKIDQVHNDANISRFTYHRVNNVFG